MRQFKNLFSAIIIFSIAIFFASCATDIDVAEEPTNVQKGYYILSEGLWGQNAAKLSYFNFLNGTYYGNFFSQQNNNKILGDVGNDMLLYGTKLYIVVNGSGYVAILNNETGILVDTVNFINNGVNRGPRYLQAYNGKIYVSLTEGKVVAFDTTAFNITNTITVGSNPEQMTIAGNMLYVTNSGGFNYPNYDSTVSVVNLQTNTEIQKVTVGLNPYNITGDGNGNLYVICSGNYSTVPTKLVKLSTATLQTTSQKQMDNLFRVYFYNNTLYAIGNFTHNSKNIKVQALNSSLAITDTALITDANGIQTPYGLAYNEVSKQLYVLDARNYVNAGMLYVYDVRGNFVESKNLSPAVIPTKLIFN